MSESRQTSPGQRTETDVSAPAPATGAPRSREQQSLAYCLGTGKRVMDLCFSLWLFVLLFLPGTILGLIPALRRRKCPVLAESRTGKDGRAFDLFKFRTLDTELLPGETEAETRARLERNNSSALLRRFGVDEVPQLWNVIRGDMSLVGPRPHRPGRTYRYREKIRPGITGLWQIRRELGPRIHRAAAYHRFYLRRATPFLDVWILWRTLRLFLGGRRLDYYAPGSRAGGQRALVPAAGQAPIDP